jgi:5-methylthioadenosine/S-adenosylhomocysteine deaminase
MGSDNMAEDMVEVLRTGLFMERIRARTAAIRRPSRRCAGRRATAIGALGVPDGGWLKAGNKADLIMVDLTRAHMVPVLRAVSTFVHQAQARDVEAVMVDGQWLMRDGKVLWPWTRRPSWPRPSGSANTAWPRLFAKRRDLKVPDGFSPDALP